MDRAEKNKRFLIAIEEHVKKVRTAPCYSQIRVYPDGGLSRATMASIEYGQIDAQIWTVGRIAELQKCQKDDVPLDLGCLTTFMPPKKSNSPTE